MIERWSRVLFFTCLFSCACMVLTAIWMGNDDALGEAYFKTIATLFVIGLASFLTWFVITARKALVLLKR